MNHGPAFQALWRQLRNEVRALQNKGYYGDGTHHPPPQRSLPHSTSHRTCPQDIGLPAPD